MLGILCRLTNLKKSSKHTSTLHVENIYGTPVPISSEIRDPGNRSYFDKKKLVASLKKYVKNFSKR